MAREIRESDAPLTSGNRESGELARFAAIRELLENEPFSFHFFQAVRLLHRIPSLRFPAGNFAQPAEEVVRFSARPSLAFPASDIHDLVWDEAGQAHMEIEFMGLCASLPVLPVVYTEYLLEKAREKDRSMEDFFNIFNHRIVSLFYRAWEKYRCYIEFERSGKDKLSPKLLDFLGLGTAGLQERTGLPDLTFLHYLGNLAHQIRSSLSLKQILEEYFEVPVEIQEFAGTWRRLSPQDRTVLSETGGDNERLGIGTVAGDEVWDIHGRIGVALGPMPIAEYIEFLPGHGASKALASWLRFFLNGNYEAEIKLILAREDVPACNLGSSDGVGPRLGLMSWLKTKPKEYDPADATYIVS
jgi:type VI secretion system protein ImpH